MRFKRCDKYVCHSKRVLDIAEHHGWKPGARYTNLRDVKHVQRLGFLDIDWKNYSFERHFHAVKRTRPELTVARDVLKMSELPSILREAEQLLEFAGCVIVVPKDPAFEKVKNSVIPGKFRLGFSVPTRYGGTSIAPQWFGARDVHLLGGRPDVQRRLAAEMNVRSLDTNRFTLDAQFGDYFNGTKFQPHPVGGYENCIRSSLEHINAIWD